VFCLSANGIQKIPHDILKPQPNSTQVSILVALLLQCCLMAMEVASMPMLIQKTGLLCCDDVIYEPQDLVCDQKFLLAQDFGSKVCTAM
jgi:hypothetical protein